MAEPLPLTIDAASATPPSEQVVQQVTALRDAGALPAEHRLPPVRALAADLGLAPNTVAKAYRALEASGVIETRGRHGSFIAGRAGVPAEAAAAASGFVRTVRRLGLSTDAALALVREALGQTSALTRPEVWWGRARRVLFVHAHPDDETLATGGLIADLARRGVEVAVLTATRGEQGEVVPGAFSALAGTHELARHREAEVARACRTLGVRHRAWLGEAPARAAGRAPRPYTDSGMRWLDAAETVAGPGDAAGPDALSLADPGEVAGDIAAYARAIDADLVISYDAHGGYGHPDHVALHAPSRAAASWVGVPFLEVASDPDAAGHLIETPALLGVVSDALRAYASQLTVEGAEVVHVGGQRQPIQLRFVLRDPA